MAIRKINTLAPVPGTKVCLASPGDHPLSRHTIVASDPQFILRVKNGVMTRDENGATTTIRDPNPWEYIDQLLQQHPQPLDLTTPFTGGLIGYIGYEAGRYLETLPGRARDDLNLPDMWLMWPRKVERVLPALAPSHRDEPLTWTSQLSCAEYCAKVERITAHIRAGDIYQANLSQRFSAPFTGDAYAFWQRLMQKNPAPFFAYIHDPEFQILCTSPERLLQQRGPDVESRPIKGTRPRGATVEADAEQRTALLESPKEAAELAMIVDLVRNDLNRVCLPGSVQVAQHRMIEAYQNVFHQVSVVTGKLPQEHTMLRALAALFPGGSITGCPKIRAQEIIDDLELHTRGIYTGSIGYASTHGTQDWNIAIRTAVVKDGHIHLSVGGGIVADSDPEKEYEETLHKAATFFSV